MAQEINMAAHAGPGNSFKKLMKFKKKISP